jgi:hypothetical protein
MATIGNEKSAIQHTDAEIGATPHAPAPAIHLHHDAVAPEAIGGLYHEMPANYYRSPAFIGTLVVRLKSISQHRKLRTNRFLRLLVLPKSQDT